MTKRSFDNARVWRLGADVDTDALAPGAYMKHGLEVIGWHCLEAVRTDFASGVHEGDVIVAGVNFGIGSSREQAAGVLRHLGLAAVIAPSYSGLYFRNAFNLGLLLLTCPEADQIEEGERVGVTFEGDTPLVIRANGQRLACAPIPEFLMDMVDAGGLLPLPQRFQPHHCRGARCLPRLVRRPHRRHPDPGQVGLACVCGRHGFCRAGGHACGG